MSNEEVETKDLTIKTEREVLRPEQIANYEKLLIVCDRNVNLDGRSNLHNTDFCLIKDKKGGEHIEPTRDFCLKAISIFGCNYEPVGPPTIIEDGRDKLVSRDVKVSLGDQYVVETGGSSTKECELSGARAFHDAMARAMTRGMKRALEALIGLPFVNMMIKELFGRYSVPEVERPPVVSRTAKPIDMSEPVKNLANALYLELKGAALSGVITNHERDGMWNKCLIATADFNNLKRQETTIRALLTERGA